MPEKSPKFFTPEEVCERWKISRPSLQRLTDRGVLPFVRIGGQLRFAEAALTAYETRQANITGPDARKGQRAARVAA
jgi:excisionase family DNA binding protein